MQRAPKRLALSVPNMLRSVYWTYWKYIQGLPSFHAIFLLEYTLIIKFGMPQIRTFFDEGVWLIWIEQAPSKLKIQSKLLRELRQLWIICSPPPQLRRQKLSWDGDGRESQKKQFRSISFIGDIIWMTEQFAEHPCVRSQASLRMLPCTVLFHFFLKMGSLL